MLFDFPTKKSRFFFSINFKATHETAAITKRAEMNSQTVDAKGKYNFSSAVNFRPSGIAYKSEGYIYASDIE